MKKKLYKFIKRCFDFISSLIVFIVISPFFVVTYLIVRIKLGKPVFFSQIRSGKDQKPFKIIKFRTLTDERDSDGKLFPDEKRQTQTGMFLRSSSLDELPELLSIMKGDMSVIGPRPLPTIYDSYYTERERKRFEVRGGLIPPDSVETSVIISWDKQLEYEAAYAENLSMKNDIKILFAAIRIVLRRKKSNYGGYVRLPLNEERSLWNTKKN